MVESPPHQAEDDACSVREARAAVAARGEMRQDSCVSVRRIFAESLSGWRSAAGLRAARSGVRACQSSPRGTARRSRFGTANGTVFCGLGIIAVMMLRTFQSSTGRSSASARFYLVVDATMRHFALNNDLFSKRADPAQQ